MRGKCEERILVLKNGKFKDIVSGVTATSKKYKISKTLIYRYIQSGKQTKKGYSFDLALEEKKNVIELWEDDLKGK